MKKYLVNSTIVFSSLLSGVLFGWLRMATAPSLAASIPATTTVQQTDASIVRQGSSSSVLFYCVTESGKEISPYDQGDTIEYSFGTANQPEIVLT